jgi:hypothetical protein
MTSNRSRRLWSCALIACTAWLFVYCKQPSKGPPPTVPAPRGATVPAAPPPPVRPEPPPSQLVPPAAAKVPATPVEVATQFFAALRAADSAALMALARFPFQLRDTGSEGDCKSGTADIPEHMPGLVQCLVSDSLLLGDLKEHPQLLAEEVGRKDLPPWTKKWRKEIQSGQALVHVMVPGNGNTSHFIVLVSDAGARALWKETTFEGG